MFSKTKAYKYVFHPYYNMKRFSLYMTEILEHMQKEFNAPDPQKNFMVGNQGHRCHYHTYQVTCANNVWEKGRVGNLSHRGTQHINMRIPPNLRDPQHKT